MNLQQALRQAQIRLEQVAQAIVSAVEVSPEWPVNEVRREAEVLLCFVLGQSRTYLFTWPDRPLTPEQQALFEGLVEQRAQGVPVAYLTGEREFWSLPLKVSPATLIPRADTECLVELALARISPSARVLDLGTGTGAIALALASEQTCAEVWAVDASPDALAIARQNAECLGLSVQLLHSDWFSALDAQRFDLIVSNPPYIAARDQHLEQGDLRFEPRSALVSGEDGLDDIRRILQDAPAHLRAQGWLLLEHGYDQGEAVRALFKAGGFVAVETQADYAGLDRVTLGRWERT